VTVDWYYWPRPSYPDREGVNWRLYEGIDANPQPGGAVLLAEWLRDILRIGTEESPYSLASQSCGELLKKGPGEVLHINVYLDLFPPFSFNGKTEEGEVYRAKNYLGHIAPDNKRQYPVPLEILDDSQDADIVIIYDMGDGFRFEEQVWPEALKGDRKPLVIYNMYPPLFKGALWEHIVTYHKERLILILNADDLRKTGTNISRSVSWEKSAIELLWEMTHKEDLTEVKELNNVIVRFSYEGAIHYRGKKERSKLYFDPVSVEGGFWDYKKLGDMKAVTLVFLANLSACLISKFKEKKGDSQKGKNDSQKGSNENRSIKQVCIEDVIKDGLEEGLKEGLIKSRKFLINGYGNGNGKPDFFKRACLSASKEGNKKNTKKDIKENSRDFTPDQDDSYQNQTSKSPADYIADTLLPSIEEINEHSDPKQSNPQLWTILKEKTKELSSKELSSKELESSSKESGQKDSTYLEKLAFLIVKKGLSSIRDFPVGKFGKLITVDRAEIESFRSIKNIMEEYISSEKNRKPLSIAVFGAPGSGKSFGITEVAESIDSERIKKITFNISQFTSTKDLANAFQRIRDISLKGKIPLVFFDEFDSRFEDEELGWIKYFLVPMQDGEFMGLESMHPIGKSIFVFAGSTYSNLKAFFGFCNYSKAQSQSYSETDSCRKLSNKCPDFLSRLRGYVNILGLNRANENDETYIIRRAIQLRSLIEENAPKIIRENNAHISCEILNALINVPEYMHGVRSMQAIVEMSMLHEKDSWETAYLPPRDQLELHIKSIDEFYTLLAQKKQSCMDIK